MQSRDKAEGHRSPVHLSTDWSFRGYSATNVGGHAAGTEHDVKRGHGLLTDASVEEAAHAAHSTLL